MTEATQAKGLGQQQPRVGAQEDSGRVEAGALWCQLRLVASNAQMAYGLGTWHAIPRQPLQSLQVMETLPLLWISE